MKNKIILSVLASSLMFSSAYAEVSELDVVKQDLDNLKQELNMIKANISANEDINNELFESLTKTNEDIIDMEERVDDVESIALTDKIQFGVDMRQELDGGKITYTDGTSKSKYGAGWSRIRLNMHYDVTPDMEFFGRLSMMKNWGNGSSVYNPYQFDHTEGRQPNTSALFVERAYMTWQATDGDVPIEVLIGRLPSSDGPSIQFKDNDTRKAMVSAMAFDGASDGGQIAFGTSKILNLPKSQLRLAYAKYIQDNNFLNYASPGLEDTNVYGIFFDTALGENTNSSFNMAYIKAFDIMNEMGEDTGDLSIAYAFLEFPDLYDSGLSLFAHTGVSMIDPSGKTTMGSSLIGSTNTDTKTGFATWLGARYKFDAPNLHNPRVGLEYNYGSKYWTNMTSGYSESINKFAFRGNTIDLYYSQPINDFAYFRLGYQILDKKYSGDASNVFAPTGELGDNGAEIDKVERFNVTFNLKF